MKWNIIGELSGLEEGIDILIKDLGIELDSTGLCVYVRKSECGLTVNYDGNTAEITYHKRAEFFRAMGLLAENINSGTYHVEQTPYFDTLGPMIDVSRNAVMRVDSIKRYLRKLALMGANAFMLYMEDVYEVAQYPHFGYMRGRYTFEELKECDDYAYALGIEMIPCIQTLGHLETALRWPYAAEFKNAKAVLLVGEEKTYEFIENLIKAASAPFRSKRIHIGMDEAYGVEQGRYARQNGVKPVIDVMKEHVMRVKEILDRYGLRPMMWGDMIYNQGSQEGSHTDENAVFDDSVRESVPENMQLVYWDYYHEEEAHYEKVLEKYKQLSDDVIFAGGIWTWKGNCPDNHYTERITKAALDACKKAGVREVFATIWNDTLGIDAFTSLYGMQLWAEYMYCDEVKDIGARIKICVGCEADVFTALSDLDEVAFEPRWQNINPSSYLFWQDILCGLFDYHVARVGILEGHYQAMTKRLSEIRQREQGREFELLLRRYETLSAALEYKTGAGVKLKQYYDAHDLKGLVMMKNEYLPETKRRIQTAKEAARALWYADNKMFGWEIQDIRYSGIIGRIDTAISRLDDYLSGKIPLLEELEEERLRYHKDLDLFWAGDYFNISSASHVVL